MDAIAIIQELKAFTAELNCLHHRAGRDVSAERTGEALERARAYLQSMGVKEP